MRFADDEGRGQTVKDLGLLRLRAGDWTVLNPLADAEGTPSGSVSRAEPSIGPVATWRAPLSGTVVA